MKRKRFTEERIIGVLREHEAGGKAADLAPLAASTRYRAAWPSACTGERAPVLRLPVSVHPAAAERRAIRDRSHLSALS